MGLTATASGGGDFTPIPEGTHIARCVRMVDLGTQESTGQYGTKRQHKVLLAFEIPGETVEFDGEQRPALIHNRYTLSLHEKAKLCQHLEAWRGQRFTDEEKQGFDLRAVLGHACLLTVLHNVSGGRTYANISAIAKPPKGTQVPPAHHPLVQWALEDGENDVFKGFTEGLQNTIRRAQEWQGSSNGAADYQDAPPPQDDGWSDSGHAGLGDDDIPF